MPFKKGKSPADVAKRINKALTEDLPKDIERGLFDMYTTLSGHADFYTPLDTGALRNSCLLYTSPSPRDGLLSRMPSSA